jgi:hypothetical protein
MCFMCFINNICPTDKKLMIWYYIYHHLPIDCMEDDWALWHSGQAAI